MAVGRHAQVMQVTPGTRWRHAAPKKTGETARANAKARPHWRPKPHAAPVGIWSILATNRRTKNNKGERGERRVHVDAAMATGTYGSKKRTGCACITYNYTCLHNRKSGNFNITEHAPQSTARSRKAHTCDSHHDHKKDMYQPWHTNSDHTYTR